VFTSRGTVLQQTRCQQQGSKHTRRLDLSVLCICISTRCTAQHCHRVTRNFDLARQHDV
jgi:hypothetical protein